MDYFWLSLNAVVLVITGFATSLTDIKKGKIMNKHVALVIFSVFAANIIYFQDFSRVASVLLSTSFSLFIGFMIWMGNLWTAGDAKLFVAYSSLLSGFLVPGSFFEIPVLILINTVTPVFFFYLFLIMKRTTRKEKIEVFLDAFSPKNIATISLFIFSFTWIVKLLSAHASFVSNYFVTITLLFLILYFITNFMKTDILKVSLAIGILRLILDFSNIFTLFFAKDFLFILMGFLILRFFILKLGAKVFSSEIKVDELEEGMLILDRIREEGQKYFKESAVDFSLVGMLRKKQKKYLIENSPTGLSRKEVEEIKRLKKEGKLNFDSLSVHQTLPFAPLLFLGVFITFAVRENIFIYLFNLIFT